jgi:hypothetical protein
MEVAHLMMTVSALLRDLANVNLAKEDRCLRDLSRFQIVWAKTSSINSTTTVKRTARILFNLFSKANQTSHPNKKRKKFLRNRAKMYPKVRKNNQKTIYFKSKMKKRRRKTNPSIVKDTKRERSMKLANKNSHKIVPVRYKVLQQQQLRDEVRGEEWSMMPAKMNR